MIEAWIMETGITFATWNGLTVRLLDWKRADDRIVVETMTGARYLAPLEDMDFSKFGDCPDSLTSGRAAAYAYRLGKSNADRGINFSGLWGQNIPYTFPVLRAAYVKGFYNGRGWSLKTNE